MGYVGRQSRVAAEFGVNHSVICPLMAKDEEMGDVSNRLRAVRPRATEEDDTLLSQYIAEEPFTTGVVDKTHSQEANGHRVSERKVSRSLSLEWCRTVA